MPNETKMAAQDALFEAIGDLAENITKAALRGPEKAAILRDLSEAYRLTAGGSVPDVALRKAQSGSEGPGRAKEVRENKPKAARAR